MFVEARRVIQAARESRARDEAALLAGEGDVDRLQLRYLAAAERYAEAEALVASFDPDAVVGAATAANIFAAPIGRTRGDAVTSPGFSASLSDLRAAHEGFFPKLMGNELTPEF